LLVIGGPISDDDIAVLCERLKAVIAGSDAELVVCDVSALAPSAGAVEALARLQLTARRLDRRIRLQRASPCLEHVLQFVGLADLLGVGGPSAVQRHRHAEQREHPLRVEERVDRDDPTV
jgi:hypothetical protein